MADSTLSNLTSLTLPSQATDLLLVGRGTARPNKVAMSDALNSAALAATTTAYGVVLLAPNGGTTAGTVVQANDSRLTGGGGGVTSLAGTTNQITASASTGAVTLSLPSNLIAPGTLTVLGDTSTFGVNTSSTNSIKIITGVGNLATPRYGLLDFRNYNDLKSGAYIRVANRESDTNAFLMNVAVRSNADVLTSIATFSDSQLAILSTTNSTSAITGALIVGNGTNGGLGVSQNIYAGGDIVSTKSNGTVKSSATNANASVAAERLGTSPSSVSLIGAVSQPQLSFASDTAASYTWGRILSNGSEIVRVYNANLGSIADVAGSGIAVSGGINSTGTVTASNFALGTGGPSVSSTLNARASRQGLVFDGTTAATATTGALGTKFTIAFDITLSSLSIQQPLLFFSGSGFIGTRITSGALFWSSAASDFSTTIPVNKTSQVVIVGDGTNATPYLNGIAGTPIAYTASVGGLTNLGYAGNLANTMGPVRLYNRALSAAEVLSLYEAGAPAQTDYGFATNDSSVTVYSGQQIINGANSNFSAGTGWTLEVGNSISGGKLNLINLAYALCNNTNLRKGYRYRLTITIDSITGGTLRVYDGVNYTGIIGSTAGTKTLDYTMAADAPVFLRTEGGGAVVDDITIVPLGVTLAPDANQPGGGLAWYDTSGNNATLTLPASGVSWNVRTSGKINGPLTIGTATFGGAKLNVYATPADAGYLYGIRLSDESTTTLAFGLQTPSATSRPFIHGNSGLGFGTAGTIALNITSAQQVQVLATTNSTSAITGALIVGNGTNGGIGVSGRSYFAEQVNSKAFESTGGPTVFDANGGISLAGNGGSAYAAIKAYTNAAGTEKTISFNQSGGAGVNIGGTGAVEGGGLRVGSIMAVGTSTDVSIGLNHRPTLTTGSFQYGIYSVPVINAATADSGFFSLRTAASAAVSSAFALRAFTPTLGSGSTVNTIFGLKIENFGGAGITHAYGIDIAAQSGASTTNVGLRNAGTTLLTGDLTTSANLFAGTTYFSAPNGVNIDTTGSASLRWNDSGTQKWWLYKLSGDVNLYLRDMVNARMQATFTPGASSGTAASYLWSSLYVDSTVNSTSYNSGALQVVGGVGIGGAIFSQQNSNAIVTGTNIANTNQGNAATLRHTLTAGTNTSTIEAYSNGHATFPGRLRFGTPNGQMDFVPSGVLGLSISASEVTVPNTLIANAATNAFRIPTAQTPASQTAAGTQGQITWDASYLYVCTSTNNWGRSSLNWAGGGGSGGSSNIWIPASEWIPRTTNGCGINSLESTTNRVNYDVLEFDPAAVEYAQAMVVLPNNWNAGTVTAKFHWTAASGSGDVVWQLSGRAYANDDAIDQATGTVQSSTDTLTAANDLDISPATSAITLAGTAANGNPVVFELSRNATAGGDTLGTDARLIGVEITYSV
jgi:hypothetical protein